MGLSVRPLIYLYARVTRLCNLISLLMHNLICDNVDICVSFFSHFCDKIPNKSNFRRGGFIGSLFEGIQSALEGKGHGRYFCCDRRVYLLPPTNPGKGSREIPGRGARL